MTDAPAGGPAAMSAGCAAPEGPRGVALSDGRTALTAPTVSSRLADVLGLRYEEDLRTLAFCAVFMALVWWQLTHEVESRLAQWALFLATSLSAFQGAVSVHNAVHCPAFKQQWRNSVFQCVLSVWFGHCAASYVPGHNLSHHRNLQTPRDVMRTTKMQYRWNLLNGLLFMPTILLSTSVNDANYFNAQKALGRPIYAQLRFEAVVYVGAQLLAAALCGPRRWLWAMWLPCLIGKYFIISLNMLQHDGTEPEHKYNHSRNFTGRTLNYLCFNNGYHGVHHMWPGRHWSLLEHDHETRVKPHMHPGLDRESILGYIFEQFVYPGQRVDFRGLKIPIVDDGPDEPWFYATTESYSDRDPDARVWTKGLATFGPDQSFASQLGSSQLGSQLASRSAKSYTTMPETN
jgi:fatty acid desaturase